MAAISRTSAFPVVFGNPTAVTEGTANFLVNRRMNKAQQMRWSRRGADLLLQVRCAVYNGAFGHGFGNLFKATSRTVQ